MKHMLVKSMAAVLSLSVLAQLGGALSASACELTKDELTAKYGYLMQSREAVGYSGIETFTDELHGDAAYAPRTGETVESGEQDGFLYDLLDTGCVRITGLAENALSADSTVLEIPAEIGSAPVTEIGFGAFQLLFETAPAIREIRIPDSVRIIAERAFASAFGSAEQIAAMNESERAALQINIPAQVQFIGWEAFLNCGAAICNAQQTDRVIRLPESLEYISYTAFGTIGSRVYGGIEVDMPDSLVFMSDYYFSNGGRWSGHSHISREQHISVPGDDVPAEDLPLLQAAFSRGFRQNEANIFTMGDLIGAEKHTQVLRYTDLYMPVGSSYDILNADGTVSSHEADIPIEKIRANAALYAPELLGEKPLRAPSAAASAGDVDRSGDVNIGDAVLLARYLAEDSSAVLCSDNADLNADGNVDAADLDLLLTALS